MFGCLRRLGCLALLLLVAAGLWFTRDRWKSRVFGERNTAGVIWRPVTSSGAVRARDVVESLGHESGPVFVNLSAEDLGSLMIASAGSRLPASISAPQVGIADDKVLLRATINLDDISGLKGLGPITSMMDKREPFECSGTLDIVRPGLAEYRVESAKLGTLVLPSSMIPRLLARFSKAERFDGVAANGIAFEVPTYVGDVRVARGRVTLYKNVK
jgi:hypothetical protein